MSVRTTANGEKVAMYDSVTDQAFGPVFDSEQEAQLFLTWYVGQYDDPRVSWFQDPAAQQVFWVRYREWHRATHDESGFRDDIAIQIAREAE